MFHRYRSQEDWDNATPTEPPFSNDDVADVADWLAEVHLTPTDEHIIEAMDALVVKHIRSDDFQFFCHEVRDVFFANS